MLRIFRDPGGTLGYELLLPNKDVVMVGDGYTKESDITDFMAELRAALKDETIARSY